MTTRFNGALIYNVCIRSDSVFRDSLYERFPHLTNKDVNRGFDIRMNLNSVCTYTYDTISHNEWPFTRCSDVVLKTDDRKILYFVCTCAQVNQQTCLVPRRVKKSNSTYFTVHVFGSGRVQTQTSRFLTYIPMYKLFFKNNILHFKCKSIKIVSVINSAWIQCENSRVIFYWLVYISSMLNIKKDELKKSNVWVRLRYQEYYNK